MKILSYKSIDSAYLWITARAPINKNQKYFFLPDHHLAENFVFVFVSAKGQTRDKSKFAIIFVGIIVTITFI